MKTPVKIDSGMTEFLVSQFDWVITSLKSRDALQRTARAVAVPIITLRVRRLELGLSGPFKTYGEVDNATIFGTAGPPCSRCDGSCAACPIESYDSNSGLRRKEKS